MLHSLCNTMIYYGWNFSILCFVFAEWPKMADNISISLTFSTLNFLFLNSSLFQDCELTQLLLFRYEILKVKNFLCGFLESRGVSNTKIGMPIGFGAVERAILTPPSTSLQEDLTLCRGWRHGGHLSHHHLKRSQPFLPLKKFTKIYSAT